MKFLFQLANLTYNKSTFLYVKCKLPRQRGEHRLTENRCHPHTTNSHRHHKPRQKSTAERKGKNKSEWQDNSFYPIAYRHSHNRPRKPHPRHKYDEHRRNNRPADRINAPREANKKPRNRRRQDKGNPRHSLVKSNFLCRINGKQMTRCCSVNEIM